MCSVDKALGLTCDTIHDRTPEMCVYGGELWSESKHFQPCLHLKGVTILKPQELEMVLIVKLTLPGVPWEEGLRNCTDQTGLWAFLWGTVLRTLNEIAVGRPGLLWAAPIPRQGV